MEENKRNWILSLSCVSFMGPYYDIEQIKKSGFYKNIEENELKIDLPILKSTKCYGHTIESAFGISNINGINELLSYMYNNGGIAMDLFDLYKKYRTYDIIRRKSYATVKIRYNSYKGTVLKDLFNLEDVMPEKGLSAYEIANLIMLVRYSERYGGLSDAVKNSILERVAMWVLDNYTSYEEFGRDAAIGRQVHMQFLRTHYNKSRKKFIKPVLAISYYSIWQYISWPSN